MKSCSGQNLPVARFSACAGGVRPCRRNRATCAARQMHEQGRQEPDVQAVEPGQRLVAVVGAADHDLLEVRAEHRAPAHDVGRDLGRPVALLVPGEQVAGQAEAQGQEQAGPCRTTS